MNKYTIKKFQEEYPDDDACLDKIYKLIYGNMTECPKCGSIKEFIRIKTRRCYQCRACYHQIYPTAGTVFHRTTTPLTYWFFAIFLFTVSKNGLSACELQRHLGVTYKTAFRMLKQIRMLISNDESIMKGVIELDEAYIGGKNKNRHKDKKVKNAQGRAYKDKSPVFGILERSEGGSSRVIAYTLRDVKAQTLQSVVYEKVAPGSAIMTDEWNAYTGLNKDYEHGICFHGRGNYVSGVNSEIYTNGLENFWSTVKRSINGSYVRVSPKYLQLYINEFVFRYNNRKSAEMFNDLINCLAF
ncbi:MAG: hypothetical protein BGO31_11805 [Bacteroidetes bacterium 43-16]|nr:MAG: hypothetical protein BGO31_11805 [Bacteroidetes bacterium 43-16]